MIPSRGTDSKKKLEAAVLQSELKKSKRNEREKRERRSVN